MHLGVVDAYVTGFAMVPVALAIRMQGNNVDNSSSNAKGESLASNLSILVEAVVISLAS